MRWMLAVLVLMVLAPARGDSLDPDVEAARRHYQRGSQLYQQAHYAEALGEFTSANELRPEPAMEFNIARCLDRLERWSEALEHYRHYVASSPNNDAATESRRRVAILEQRVAKSPRKNPEPVVVAPTAPVIITPEPEPRAIVLTAAPIGLDPRARSVGGAALGIGVVGIASLAAGLALYFQSGSRFNALDSSCAPGCDPSSWQNVQTRERAGIALIAVGGVLTATGLAMLPVWMKLRRPRPVSGGVR